MARILAHSLLAAALAFPAAAPAQVISYDVSFPNAEHHELQVRATFTGLPQAPLALRMSRSSPGRYALHEFAKNVYAVSATDGRGRPLTLTRPNPYQWDAAGHDGTVKLTYTLFADRADGTYAQVDRSHAHLNMPAVFMWAVGLDARPIQVRFSVPAGSGWKVATQLHPADQPLTYSAPNLQYFMDSPTELSDHMVREWTVTSNGRTYPIRMAIHHLGTAAEADSFAALARRVVDQEIAVYGETPIYDVGSYTFIADYLPWASGDGMEHRNSTILSSSGSLARNGAGLLGTVAHEFFHSWNVERIRPRGLEPFDFTRANMSGELWFAEGFTSYYGPLLIHRAGITQVADYAGQLSGALSFVIGSPARKYFSPVEMSMQAPFVDAATSIDPTNRPNTFISYYTWGAVLGLGLDLTLRTRFDKPLDGFMRMMWQRFGKPEVPYTLEDLERTLAAYTADPAFAKEFFQRYIVGREVVDYAPLLARAGLLLRPSNPGAAFFGLVQLDYDSTGATVNSTTTIGSPLYEAGIDRGDRIISLDGKPLADDAAWQAAKTAHRAGDRVPVEYVSRGETRKAMLVATADPRLEVVPYEAAGKELTAEMRSFREAWLGAR